MNEKPLIHTIKGNLPISDLEYRTKWTDDEDNTIFQETYLLDGEVVRQSVHVMSKRGVLATGIGSALG